MFKGLAAFVQALLDAVVALAQELGMLDEESEVD